MCSSSNPHVPPFLQGKTPFFQGKTPFFHHVSRHKATRPWSTRPRATSATWRCWSCCWSPAPTRQGRTKTATWRCFEVEGITSSEYMVHLILYLRIYYIPCITIVTIHMYLYMCLYILFLLVLFFLLLSTFIPILIRKNGILILIWILSMNINDICIYPLVN